MSKRAIYLDDRERDLARRVFDHALWEIRRAINRHATCEIDEPARKWFRDEVAALRRLFDEPESIDEPDKEKSGE